MQLQEFSIVYKDPQNTACPKVTGSTAAAEVFRDHWDNDMNVCESFLVLHLSSNNKVKGIHRVSKGGITGTVADVRLIMAMALKTLSVAIILAHNHPSGNLKPSNADIALTKKVKEAGQVLDIMVMDHIILTPESYFSMADEGLM